MGLVDEGNAPQLVPQGVEGPVGAAAVFVLVAIVSPLLETLLLAGILGGLSILSKNRVALAVISAVIWAGLHSLVAPIWGLVIAWPFFIFFLRIPGLAGAVVGARLCGGTVAAHVPELHSRSGAGGGGGGAM